MKQLAAMLDAGLLALNGGLDAVHMSDGLRGGIHLGVAVAIAMLSVYLAAPVARVVTSLVRKVSV